MPAQKKIKARLAGRGKVQVGRLGRIRMMFSFRSMARNKTNCKQTASSLRFNSEIPLKLKLELAKRDFERRAIWNISSFRSAFETIQFHDGLVIRSMLLKGNLKEGGGGEGGIASTKLTLVLFPYNTLSFHYKAAETHTSFRYVCYFACFSNTRLT